MVYAISGCIIVSWNGNQGQFQCKCNFCGDIVTHTKSGFSMSGNGTSSHGSHYCSKCGKSSEVKIGKSS